VPGFRLVAAMLLYVHSCGSTCKPHAGNRLADHKAENRRLTMGEMLIEGSEGTLRLDGDGGLWLRSHGEKHLQNFVEPDAVAIVFVAAGTSACMQSCCFVIAIH
jgi:hypothetical protein